MAESDNPLLPLQRPSFGNPATHKAHPLMFQAEYDIRFRHPAYEDPYGIFIEFIRLVHLSSQWGIATNVPNRELRVM